MDSSELIELLIERVEAMTNESPHLYGLGLDNRWAAVDDNEREVLQKRSFNSEFIELLCSQYPKEIAGFPNIDNRNDLESKLQLSHKKYIAYPRISVLRGNDGYRKPSEEDINNFLFG